jgi:hypothetical protein
MYIPWKLIIIFKYLFIILLIIQSPRANGSSNLDWFIDCLLSRNPFSFLPYLKHIFIAVIY